MFARMRGAMGATSPAGAVMGIQMELNRLKAAPVLNPHFDMVHR